MVIYKYRKWIKLFLLLDIGLFLAWNNVTIDIYIYSSCKNCSRGNNFFIRRNDFADVILKTGQKVMLWNIQSVIQNSFRFFPSFSFLRDKNYLMIYATRNTSSNYILIRSMISKKKNLKDYQTNRKHSWKYFLIN